MFFQTTDDNTAAKKAAVNEINKTAENVNTPSPAAENTANSAVNNPQTTQQAVIQAEAPEAPISEPPILVINDGKQQKPMQFTAKANNQTKEFCKNVEEVIKWRIEKGYSTDRQHCILQMFNFAVNHADGWSFAVPDLKKIYL